MVGMRNRSQRRKNQRFISFSVALPESALTRILRAVPDLRPLDALRRLFRRRDHAIKSISRLSRNVDSMSRFIFLAADQIDLQAELFRFLLRNARLWSSRQKRRADFYTIRRHARRQTTRTREILTGIQSLQQPFASGRRQLFHRGNIRDARVPALLRSRQDFDVAVFIPLAPGRHQRTDSLRARPSRAPRSISSRICGVPG